MYGYLPLYMYKIKIFKNLQNSMTNFLQISHGA